jgi:hypothetical protein
MACAMPGPRSSAAWRTNTQSPTRRAWPCCHAPLNVWDRLAAARAAIAEHGELVIDRYGAPKLNPACALEKDARAGFLAAMKALNLDLEPLRDGPGRPPAK